MLEILLPYLLAGIVSIAGLFAPAITSRINQKFTEKEREAQIKRENIEHLRKIFEAYVGAAGEYIAQPSETNKQRYMGCYALAYFYAPENAKELMKALNYRLYSENFEKIPDALNVIIQDLQQHLDSLLLKQK